MKTGFNIYLFLGISLLVICFLFTGLWCDDEFDEPGLFFKHSPSLRMEFYSPIGMSDMSLADLSEEKASAQLDFNEFIIKQGVQYPGNLRDKFVPLLYAFTLTVLLYGFLPFFKRQFTIKHMGQHFLVNGIVFFAGTTLLLSFHSPISLLCMLSVILFVNFITAFLFSKSQPRSIHASN
ncbi:MAG TPA: hypothetical protein VI112_08895 [Bacteroidia bacterium]